LELGLEIGKIVADLFIFILEGISHLGKSLFVFG